jgi:hypothetical protein
MDVQIAQRNDCAAFAAAGLTDGSGIHLRHYLPFLTMSRSCGDSSRAHSDVWKARALHCK